MVCPSGAPRRLAALAVSVRGVGTPRLPSPRPASCPTTLLPEAAGNPARADTRPAARGDHPSPARTPQAPLAADAQLTVQVADLAVLDCWKVTSKWWGPG